MSVDSRAGADYAFQEPQSITLENRGEVSPEKLLAEFQATAAEFRANLHELRQEVATNANEDTLVRIADNFRMKWSRVFKDQKWQKVEGISRQLQEIQTILSTIDADWVRGELTSRAQRIAQTRPM